MARVVTIVASAVVVVVVMTVAIVVMTVAIVVVTVAIVVVTVAVVVTIPAVIVVITVVERGGWGRDAGHRAAVVKIGRVVLVLAPRPELAAQVLGSDTEAVTAASNRGINKAFRCRGREFKLVDVHAGHTFGLNDVGRNAQHFLPDEPNTAMPRSRVPTSDADNRRRGKSWGLD